VDEISNWYENILFEKISQLSQEQLETDPRSAYDPAMWSDIACLALNHLPPRYVRHAVDMRFYLSPQEQQEMDQRVDKALQNAIQYVKQHPAPETNSAKQAATIN
jgi:hypothetical protein